MQTVKRGILHKAVSEQNILNTLAIITTRGKTEQNKIGGTGGTTLTRSTCSSQRAVF